MGVRRVLSDWRELGRSMGELLRAAPDEEEMASWRLAKSARIFSRRSRAVVDDKLSTSAILMRAGEVDEATRLLAEVERDVRVEEAALIETVNEVKVAQAIRRDRVTRVRLARMLAVALLGSSVLGMSAIGMSLASLLDARANPRADLFASGRSAHGGARRDAASVAPGNFARKGKKEVRIAGVKLALTRSQMKALADLTDGTLEESNLHQFLGLIDLPSNLAAKVTRAIVATTAPVTAEVDVARVVGKAKKAARAAKRAARAAKRAAKAQQPQPQPSPQEKPSPSPSPSPSDSPDGSSGNGGKEDDGESPAGPGSGGEGDGGEDEGLPVPGGAPPTPDV